MIVNLPTPESLNSSALRSHFSACESLFSIIEEFERYYDMVYGDSKNEWQEDWETYYIRARDEVQTVLTALAHANELALRARICTISPYLLLLNSENRFKSSALTIDFTELRTIDAVDLPMAVNGICEQRLSDKYISDFQTIRSLRNKIVHLGVSESNIEISYLVSLIVSQFNELWPESLWLASWLKVSENSRRSHFFDYKNYTGYTDILYLVPLIMKTLNKSQFEKLFGFKKSQRRYICYECCSAGCIERHGVFLGDHKTAFLTNDTSLFCSMCGEVFNVERAPCVQEDCKGDVIFSTDRYSPVCCTCGDYQEP